MITVTAFKWVPPVVQGLVRDLRVRWALEEAGMPYEVRLIDQDVQKSANYREWLPFGQVPAIDDDGWCCSNQVRLFCILANAAKPCCRLINGSGHAPSPGVLLH
jgi:Glutathione S-transferase, N-terminal domain